jgi:type II secretory pathway pseudopilin PulG
MLSNTYAIQAGGSSRASSTRKKFTLLEGLVAVTIMGVLVVMAMIVWSNIRENAYDAKARRNQENAEATVKNYWSSVGQSQGGYKGITAAAMQSIDPKNPWIFAKASSIEKMDLGNIPSEYFLSTMIVEEDNMPADELVVASLSETGTVYITRFKELNTVESSKLTFDEFRVKEGQNLQAAAARIVNPE